jgi:antitoxin YefM
LPFETTYTDLRDNLASVLDRVARDGDVVIIRRRGGGAVAIVPANEVAGLMETAYLLRSPKNSRRLRSALRLANRKIGQAETIVELRRELGLARSRN